jgi:hypothetical protein
MVHEGGYVASCDYGMALEGLLRSNRLLDPSAASAN